MGSQGTSEAVEIAPGRELPASALRYTFSRGGGPGGQNVNKVSTRATLTVHLDDLAEVLPGWAVRRLRRLAGSWLARDPDRLVISASDSRSQVANRKACVVKLRGLVVAALDRPKRRRATRPSAGAVRRRIEQKKQRGQRKAARQRDRDPGHDA